jgi:hypothetical protein
LSSRSASSRSLSTPKQSLSTPKRVLFVSGALLIAFSFAEGLAYTAGRMLDGRSIFYRTPTVKDAAGYFDRRDPVVGWPSPSEFGGNRYDATGSRPIPAFPEPGDACISIYGDSFTYGSGVPDEAAWANQLSQLLGCRVANYGVGGYGTDQALLRFEHNLDDEAAITILGHLSENIMRNVNQYRKLLAAGDPLSLKPRFTLRAGGGIGLVPLQVSTPEELTSFLERPEDRLEHEFFAPNGPSGITRFHFPFTLSMLRGLAHYHVRAELAGEPAYAQFYEVDHPAEGVEVTARILERFAASARARGKLPMLQVIPTGLDMIEYQKTGRWTYAPLLDRADELGIDVVDHGDRLMAWIGDGDPCQFYLRCNNHMNPMGNRMLAMQVAAALEERQLRQRAAADGQWPHPIGTVPDAAPPRR